MVLPSIALAGALPECAWEAVEEFDVPPLLFQALADEVQRRPPVSNGNDAYFEYGPMRLSGSISSFAASELKLHWKVVREDDCANYRAAAWFLQYQAGRAPERGYWGALNHYFYGDQKRATYPRTERVRRLYGKLLQQAQRNVGKQQPGRR